MKTRHMGIIALFANSSYVPTKIRFVPRLAATPNSLIYYAFEVCRISYSGPSNLTVIRTGSEPPAKLVHITKEALHDVAAQTIDVLHIAKLLRAVIHDLPGLEAAVIEQVDQSLFLLVGEHTEQECPQLIAVYSFFYKWFSRRTGFRQCCLSWPRVDAEGIDNGGIQTRAQVLESAPQ